MFHIPLYHYKVQDWERKQDKLLDLYCDIASDLENCNDELSDVYTDYFNNYGKTRYKNFVVDILRDELGRFQDEEQLYKPFVDEMWIQKYVEGSFHTHHNHGQLGFSSVLYVKFDANVHTPTRFIAPFPDIRGNILEHSPEVEEGSIVFFPSMLHHYVLPNEAKDVRIILSMNIREGKD